MPHSSIPKIVIIGFGNMGKALARGLQRAHTASPHGLASIIVCNRHGLSDQEELPAGLDVTKLRLLALEDLTTASAAEDFSLGSADTIILCMKPQHFVEAAERWKPTFLGQAGRPLVISILAGVPTDLVHKYFAGDCPVVRAMPNIAATVDCSATALCPGPAAKQEHVKRAKDIFDSVGKTWVVQEELLNAVTGLSGSGPAYIYMVIEALSDGGVKMGMPRQLSLDLAAQTVLGAAKLVQETKMHPAVLRDQVTTPGGTTIAAIHELEKHGLRPMLISAVVTATRKSALLAKIVEKALLRHRS